MHCPLLVFKTPTESDQNGDPNNAVIWMRIVSHRLRFGGRDNSCLA